MLRSVAQLAVMSAIVTTALYVPVGTIVVLIASALLRVSALGCITFGGFLTALEGLAAWWGILFVPALVYSAYFMPWHAKAP